MSTFYEFFAGGGMARAGLGEGWECLFSNDFDKKKGETYLENWGDDVFHCGDVGEVKLAQLKGRADLAWASFPCQDLSLAGAGAGLEGSRSGTFWPFWKLIRGLRESKRAPKLVVLENVCGAITSHGGKDFLTICTALANENYRFGAMVLDAVWFLPQSRPRLFFVAIANDVVVPRQLKSDGPSQLIHTDSLIEAHDQLPSAIKAQWTWWALPTPASRTLVFADLIEETPGGVEWHTPDETERLLSLMSERNLEKVRAAQRSRRKMVGALYRRTREENGKKVQRAEIRFDDIAGCLRTPSGGSSRQTIMVVEGERIRSRLISPRETARLMGLPENYKLPLSYNEAYHLTGDGVAVPAVRFLAENLLEPLLVEEAAIQAA